MLGLDDVNFEDMSKFQIELQYTILFFQVLVIYGGYW